MGLLSLIVGVIIFLALGFIGLLAYQTWKHAKYFKDRGAPYIGVGFPRLFRFITGRISLIESEEGLYAEAKRANSPFVGFSDLTGPNYYFLDLELCKQIYVKDFDHFVDRRQFNKMNGDLLLRKMLVSLESDHWKGLRTKLSPAFTTGKIRRMFTIFDKSSQRMCDYLEKATANTGGDFNVCDAYSKYAMDVIATCAFGIDSKSFDQAPGKLSEFEEIGQRFQFRLKPFVFFKFMLMLAAPKLADALGMQAFDIGPQKYFMRVIKDVMRQRREKGERYDDFLQLMMDTQDGLLKSEENSKEALEVMTGSGEGGDGDVDSKNYFVGATSGTALKFDDDDIVANCVLFLIGGFDTTQSVLIFAAYLLALEQDCQEKLRQEIEETKEANKGKLTYDAIHGMSYLDNVINETLRYYPPIGRLERKCTKDYKIPGTGVVVEKGLIVSLPLGPMHHDPEYYENPKKFDPDRFLPENKSKRHPFCYSPFGHGPRSCIGMRFALTEVKMMVATLVSNFKIEPCARTETPIKFDNNTTLKPLNGMWLNFQRLPKSNEE